MASGAEPVHPLATERSLVWRDERRRADIQNIGPCRVQSDASAEPLPRSARLPREPLVVGRRTGDRDILRWHMVQLDRLAFLRLVPNGHQVGCIANEPLVGQVVPTVDQQTGRNA